MGELKTVLVHHCEESYWEYFRFFNNSTSHMKTKSAFLFANVFHEYACAQI